MKTLILNLGLGTLLAVAACGKDYQVPGTTAKFSAPDEFTLLRPAEVHSKYPAAQPPQFVIGNDRRSTTVAYDVKNTKVADSQLPALSQALEMSFSHSAPGATWVTKKIMEMQGQRWVYLEFKARDLSLDVHNIVLATPCSGKLLMFNFNSTTGEFPAVEKKLRAIIASISLK